MRRSTAAVLAIFAALVLALITGCSGCGRSTAVATLTLAAGAIERDTKSALGKWGPAALHTEFFVGDGVRSGKSSRAVLTLSDSSRLNLDQNTVIRFRDRPSGSKKEHIDLEMGDATLEVGGEPLSLETDVGLAVINAGSRISLKRTEAGVRYEVSVGMARFETAGGATEVGAGQGVSIGIGSATIERYDVGREAVPAPSAAPPAPSHPDAGPPSAPTGGAVAAQIVGNGASVRAPGATAFAHLPAGAGTFAAGTTVRLAAGTSADVDRGGEHATLRGSGDFVVAEAGKSFIQAQGGAMSFSGAAREVTVTVPGGSMTVKIGASADVKVKTDATQIAVTAGSVEVRSAAGTEELLAGEQGTIGAKGTTEVVGRGPGYVDFTTSAGASFAVHDPSPPTAIGFSTGGACPEGAIVELDKGRVRSRGQGVVSILIPAGAHRYDVHCVSGGGIRSEVAAGGSVSILHDGGTARIPRTAPSTLVDTDGRNYTVLYQNILPKISVRWPNAPQASAYSLTHVAPGGKTETQGTSSASYAFVSGALREGIHKLTFDAGGSARSKTTTLDIRFDNAAPTATLTSPSNGGFAPGGSVLVSGIALDGWKISASGKALPLDDQLRFSGEVTAPAGERALAVLFENPHRGVHYYLRRAGH
jgi:ferric-dicitrate binding protein FerR (iron transport regulator)